MEVYWKYIPTAYAQKGNILKFWNVEINSVVQLIKFQVEYIEKPKSSAKLQKVVLSFFLKFVA